MIHVTTCPHCDDIKYIQENGKFHVSCKCTFAWYYSGWCSTKADARNKWENFVKLYEENQKKDPKY